jgi:hypothetical protein
MIFICCRGLFFDVKNAREHKENKGIGKESDGTIRYTVIIKADVNQMSA